MNRERRAAIAALIRQVQDLAEPVGLLREGVELVRDEEQEYYDNMPDSLQYSERGQAAEEALGHLEDALGALEDFDVESITASLGEASV